jgi:hypothetical protein
VNQQPGTALDFVQQLRTAAEPFVVRRGDAGRPLSDRDGHEAAFRRDPELYALAAAAERVPPAQRARVLFQLLAQSWAGLAPDVRHTLGQVAAWLPTTLPPDQVLAVFLALRRARANHKHTRRVVVRYLLNHPDLERLAARRRPALRDCLEHALGKNVARACARWLGEPEANPAYVQRHLLRFATDPARAVPVVRFLFRQAACPAARGGAGELAAQDAEGAPERPKTVTATNRGDIAATLVHMYRGGSNPELREALQRYVDEQAAVLPHFDGRVALVLDASGSTLGYGEREYCCVSQSQALRLVLERCCAALRVYPVGGSGEPPRPEGPTDLATAVLDALDGDPDVVAVVSDGYENVYAGDLARVTATLPALGVTTPVVFCHSKFTDKDDLDFRRPAPGLPELEFWHQDEFAEVLGALFARARGDQGERFLRGHLRQRLTALRKERVSWITR